MKHIRSKLHRCAFAVSTILCSNTALAQATPPTEEKAVERMQVTGSHIKRTDLEGPSPVTIIDREMIDKSGFDNLQQLLERLPTTGSGTFSTRGNSQDSTANGAAAISLRGFGADATLVLINGRRVATSAFAEGIVNSFVDINSIPVAAIERVDILKDGASAIYGSDAVAGVVNVVLRKDYTGTDVSLGYGQTTGPGYDETTFSTVWGTGDDKSNATLILDYFNNGQIDNSELGRFGSANQSAYGGQDLRSSRGYPGRFIVDGVTLRDPGCPAGSIAGQTCLYDYGPSSIAIPAAERLGAILNLSRKLDGDIEIFSEIAVQHNTSTAGGAATPLDEGAGLTVPGSHPNNPWKKDIKIGRYRTVDAGNRRWDITSDTLRLLAGIRGTFNNWEWEAAAQKGRSAATQTGERDQGWVRTDFLQTEINAGRYNPFGGVQNPQSVIDAITTSLVRRGKSHLTSVDAHIGGELFQLETGAVGLAAGVEYRKEDARDTPDDQFTRGLIFGTESVSAAASRSQKAAYVELSVPVMENLELQLAERYDHYSDFGGTANPKIALHFTPTETVSLRASWSQGFRAPSLAQIGLGPSQESQFFIDTFLCPTPNTNNPACASTDYTIIFAGNPNLKAEESESWNVGLVWQATPDLDFSLDLWSITQDNKIDEVPFGDVYQAECGNQNSIICIRFAPQPGQTLGTLDRINNGYFNVSSQEAQGLDLSGNYKMDLGSNGLLKFNLEWTYLDEFEKDNRSYAGEYRYPQYRWVTSADWSRNDWGVAASLSYIGEFEDTPDIDFDGSLDFDTETSEMVDSQITVDTQVYYNLNSQTKLLLGVSNLLNEDPPFAAGDGDGDLYGYVSSMYSPRGRYVYAKVSYKF
ncbi:TonB-dependent receptor [Rheinheimera riviphila]|uniref:TonB-dependent receptor n=1 Tax=Rheinheimera riviphila TaxID=1834037 RepID=A0A437R033_9GAMM|nr:TonB-dependent receptor [Rheinheimera riviphila]RVU40109.1 TonB-dependent receptor [Rheinheimera riviphila]